jgi:hypothetical protein
MDNLILTALALGRSTSYALLAINVENLQIDWGLAQPIAILNVLLLGCKRK